jgi:hypothetical protein
MAYRRDLLAIIARAEEYRGAMIKEEEADRIRYKADSLLRKIAENGTNRSCDVDLSTTIADVDIDGGLGLDEADYRAPSKDVRTYGLEVAAGYAGDDWNVSIGYQHEWRDYADRLKDDDDRMKHSLGVSVSRDVDPYSADLSASFDHEFYPNDIDEEIELDRVVQASAAIVDLLDRVLELHLAATLEARLVKDRTRIGLRVTSLLDRLFPDLLSSFSKTLSPSCLALLSQAPTPSKVLALGEEKLIALLRKVSGGNLKATRAKEIMDKAARSVGVPSQAMEETLALLLAQINLNRPGNAGEYNS